MLKRLLLTGALFLPLTVLGQITTPIPRPEVKVGDTWTFTRTDKYTKHIIGTFVHTVQKIEGGEITVESRSADGAGSPVLWIYTSDWHLRKRGRATFDPVIPGYAFPLELGKTWEGSFTSPSLSDTGPVDNNLKGKVVGVESITVPAGTFDTVKISLETRWLYKGAWRGRGRDSGVFTQTIWYAPKAKRFVRIEEERHRDGMDTPPDRQIVELKELKLN